eukprot:3960863-Alexandrium_andersonii.AAC.1
MCIRDRVCCAPRGLRRQQRGNRNLPSRRSRPSPAPCSRPAVGAGARPFWGFCAPESGRGSRIRPTSSPRWLMPT